MISHREQTEPSDGFQSAFREMQETGEDLLRLLRIKLSKAQIRTRDFAVRLALVALGGVVAVVVIITSAVFILLGLAGAIAQLLGAAMWAGFLVLGILLLGSMLGGAYFLLQRFRKQRVEELERIFERRHQSEPGAAASPR